MTTGIQWTDETWNPVTGCRKISPGCKNCYAEGVADRFWATQYPSVQAFDTTPEGLPFTTTRPRRFTDVQVHPDRLDQPLHWRKPRRVFVNSMSDLFHDDVPDDFIESVFGVMARAPHHTFQILTKRPQRMRKWFEHPLREGWSHWAPYMDAVPGVRRMTRDEWPGWPLPNVWLGVSVEDQERAAERVPLLLETPAAVRFLSCEPLLGRVELHALHCGSRFDSTGASWYDALRGGAYFGDGDPGAPGPAIDWLIVGGESGAQARPMDLAWARSLVEQGRTAGVPVFVKQLGRRPVYSVDNCGGDGMDVRVLGPTSQHAVPGIRDSHGGNIDEWPTDLRVREFPEVAA